ncbi:Protein CBG25792 [Caenorhabditis briggsae]|uniref:Protein CBG25792 n=1 Tax=Caenorhabditis briggsae TaxID=6238 RepID=B6IGL5_CAEBR|nr:Protein CBG25792 [Caenorhabditis briggsae]CAR99045.1 Protein CBG25792 [Caenorhabditis briggsae]
MSEYSGYYNARDYWLDITPQRFLHEITPGNMKFSVKNAKDDSVMVLVDCDSFMFKLKNPKSQEGLVTQKLKSGFRNIEVHEDEIGEPYDIENAPPNHLIAVCGVKRRITMLNMKEDTEESRKIKDVFCPIMFNKMRAESDGPSVDRKVLKKKNAKSKKKKKCCTIL